MLHKTKKKLLEINLTVNAIYMKQK